MDKLQTILFAIVLVKMISNCEGGAYTSIVVKTSAPHAKCGAPRVVKVTFSDFRVKSNGADVAYKRFVVGLEQRLFASNITGSSILDCGNAADCIELGARRGYDIIVYNDDLDFFFGSNLNMPFLKCGDYPSVSPQAVYLRENFLVDEPELVPLKEAPYVFTGYGQMREYRLSAYIETNPENELRNAVLSESIARTNNIILSLESGFYSTDLIAVDLSFCINAGAYGRRIFVASVFYNDTLPVAYFFKECGNTIKIPAESHPYIPPLAIYSHPGFGCIYYPSDLPDECTVTFESADSNTTNLWFSFPSWNLGDGCAGLNMTITASPGQSDEETKNVCNSAGVVEFRERSKYVITLRSHPSKQAIGFFANFTSK